MRLRRATVSCGLPCLLSVTAAIAQWGDLQSKNPPGIELSLRLTEPHSYREGELIRAEIRFPGRSPAPPQQPPREIWQFAGFLLDPAGSCGSVASPCFPSMILGFDKSEPTLRLGETSDPLAVSLNNYLPRLRPGRYRTAVLVRKQVMTYRGPMSTTYGYANPPQYALSNAVEIEVTAATEAWVMRTVASSAAILKGPPANNRETYEKRRLAADQLRFLDVPAAWSASLASLPAEESTLLNIRLEAEQAYLSLKVSIDQMAVTQKTVDQAKENYDLASGRYQVGVGSPLEITDAEVSLANARANYIQAVYGFKTSEARIEKALGINR